jgi:hypothetical protein
MSVLGQEDRRQERGVLDPLDRVRFARGQVKKFPTSRFCDFPMAVKTTLPSRHCTTISPLALCSSISLPAGTTRRMTSTCSARTRVFVCAEASADPNGRTSTTSPGFACEIAIAGPSIQGKRKRLLRVFQASDVPLAKAPGLAQGFDGQAGSRRPGVLATSGGNPEIMMMKRAYEPASEADGPTTCPAML